MALASLRGLREARHVLRIRPEHPLVQLGAAQLFELLLDPVGVVLRRSRKAPQERLRPLQLLGAEELQRAQTLLGSLAGTSQHHTDRIEEELEKLRSAELDERVLRTYAQDVACFSQSSEGS